MHCRATAPARASVQAAHEDRCEASILDDLGSRACNGLLSAGPREIKCASHGSVRLRLRACGFFEPRSCIGADLGWAQRYLLAEAGRQMVFYVALRDITHGNSCRWLA